jgi:hypothetical protein
VHELLVVCIFVEALAIWVLYCKGKALEVQNHALEKSFPKGSLVVDIEGEPRLVHVKECCVFTSDHRMVRLTVSPLSGKFVDDAQLRLDIAALGGGDDTFEDAAVSVAESVGAKPAETTKVPHLKVVK